MKIATKIILLIGVVGYLIFAIAKLSQPAEDVTCCAVEILFQDSLQEGFVQEGDVQNILAHNKISPEGQHLCRIDMPNIEKKLTQNPYIKSALCYHTSEGKLCILVSLMQPILHVIANNGEEYYLDRTGENMPIGNFNLNLCIATGNITKEYAKKELASMAEYIHDNDFWNKQIEQITVSSKDEVTLYPRVGNHTIVLGNTQNYKDKLDRMLLFYEKGLPKVGWNRYKTINLAFNGQIVCTKRDK